MTEFNEVKITRILNPTSINLGEYVINPFMGCEFSCLYCYVRSNRVISKKTKPWGEYVDIRINAPALLEKELQAKKPKAVLLGSTCECFQPIEKKYKITEKILKILTKNKVYYTILTRSPAILESIDVLKDGFCKGIYFTVNNFDDKFKSRLEPKTPAFSQRVDAVNKLLEEGLPVIPYFSPALPWISDTKDIFNKFRNAPGVEFECLNFRLVNIRDIIDNIGAVEPSLLDKYNRMLNERVFYAKTWHEIEKNIKFEAESAKKSYNIYIHTFGDYFKNSYTAEK